MKKDFYETMLLAIGTVFLLATLFTSLRIKDNLVAYNKHVCAVYGYKEDCKTALPISERLK